MLFLRYESLKEYIRLYPVTALLLLVNVAVFIAMLIAGDPRSHETLIRFGAQLNIPPYQTEYWRYLTALFVHIGFEHLLFNGFALFVFAAPLERLLGKLPYLLFYLGSGVAGNLFSQLMAREAYVSAGASGAIYGVFAAFAYLSWLRKDLFDRQTRTAVTVMLVIGVVYSFLVPQVNLYAHLGGMIGGFLIMHIMLHARQKR
jgi:rhomboid protease GluP